MIDPLAVFDRAYLWRFRADLLDVHDGDTITVLADCGFNARMAVHVRLAGIDAPELVTPEGKTAAAALALFLEGRAGAWPLRIETAQQKTKIDEVTTFERYVARVWVAGPDGDLLNVSDWLVANGLAVAKEY
jgi:endonuclease YncB( thermonuclease family)